VSDDTDMSATVGNGIGLRQDTDVGIIREIESSANIEVTTYRLTKILLHDYGPSLFQIE
jgi:hypothetical protein